MRHTVFSRHRIAVVYHARGSEGTLSPAIPSPREQLRRQAPLRRQGNRTGAAGRVSSRRSGHPLSPGLHEEGSRAVDGAAFSAPRASAAGGKESSVWTFDAFNRSGTSAKHPSKNPHEAFLGSKARMQLLRILASGIHKRNRASRDQQSLCHMHMSGTPRESSSRR